MLEDQTTDKVLFNADEIAEAFAHIESLWPKLTVSQTDDEGTLIGLPYPYIIPSADTNGGFVFREMYYWDSYFVMQGIVQTGHQELAEGMLENMIFLIKKLNMVPNGSRYYHSSRSQPPLLTSYIFEIYEKYEKSDEWLRERIAVAEREYQNVWMGTEQPNIRQVHNGLSRYYDINVTDDLAECESGWDMTTRFNGHCLSYIPVDLNSLLYKYEKDFSRAYQIFGDEDTSEVWDQKAAFRANAIENELWDAEKGFFFDLNFETGEHSEVWSLASLYPLWAGLATPDQAEKIKNNLEKLTFQGGLSATGPENSDERPIPKQWAYPNGWAPITWMSILGLSRYGYTDLAETLARKWLKTNLDYYRNFGFFREAYNVVSPLDNPVEGVYPSQTGFGWTNAVFIDLAKKYLSPNELKLV